MCYIFKGQFQAVTLELLLAPNTLGDSTDEYVARGVHPETYSSSESGGLNILLPMWKALRM